MTGKIQIYILNEALNNYGGVVLKKSCFEDGICRENKTNIPVFLFIPTRYYGIYCHLFISGLNTDSDPHSLVINQGRLGL
ncbi:MAG: hypothetical protein KO316_08680 [Methanobacterium sp.]|nr:hypothetical protein [Methanobacterium sp.]